MKTKAPKTVTVNPEQQLYVIPCGEGYTCLGFQVCIDRLKRLSEEIGVPAVIAEPGSLANYHGLAALKATAAEAFRRIGWRATCELSPQLVGLEGKRVEVEDMHGETRKFYVGRSTGFTPIHLEIPGKRSTGGPGASREYKRVTVI